MIRLAAVLAHVTAGAGVAWLVAECCGPDIAHADRGVELLGVPTWLIGAALIVSSRTTKRVAAATPVAGSRSCSPRL